MLTILIAAISKSRRAAKRESYATGLFGVEGLDRTFGGGYNGGLESACKVVELIWGLLWVVVVGPVY